MEINRSGSQPSNKGPADWFTGKVRIDPLFHATDPARVAGASVLGLSTAIFTPVFAAFSHLREALFGIWSGGVAVAFHRYS